MYPYQLVQNVDSAPLFESLLGLGSKLFELHHSELLLGYSEMLDFNIEPVQCWLCNIVFDNEGLRNVHLMEDHFQNESTEPKNPRKNSDESLKCPYCWVIAVTDYGFNNHLFMYHSKDGYKSFLKPFKDWVPSQPFKPQATCLECSKVFPNKKMLETHAKIHEAVVCTHCGKTLNNKYHLKRHMFNIHGQTDKAKYFCLKCDGKPFLNKSQLKRHEELRHEENKELCTHCGKKFCDIRQLNRHIFYTHGQTDKAQAFCQKCDGKPFMTTSDLERHISFHHQDLGVRTCPVCGTVEKGAADLLRHYESSHPGHPPLQVDEKYVFRCDLCNKIFGSTNALLNHKKKQHNTKDHYSRGTAQVFCQKCDVKPFMTTHDLERHTFFQHQDASVRTCPVCGVVEKSAAGLLRHYESSHPGHPLLQVDERYIFRCDWCNKIFGSTNGLLKHKKTKHYSKDQYC
jgi:hypothetical protein